MNTTTNNKNIIVCADDFYIDVIEKLHKDHNWNPVYWVTGNSSPHKILAAKYHGVILQNSTDAVKCKVPYKGVHEYKVIDSSVILKYSEYESIAIQMMDRMDPEGTFLYHERKRHYYDLLSHWIHTVDRLNVDLVLFSEIPHMIYDYILYAVCKEQRITTIMFSPLALFGVVIPMNDFNYGNVEIERAYKRLKTETKKESRTFSLEKKFSDSLLDMRNEYSVAKPKYISVLDEKTIGLVDKKKLNRILHVHKYFYYLLHTLRFFYRKLSYHFKGILNIGQRSECYLHRKGTTARDGGLNSREWYLYKLRAYWKKKGLLKFYNEIVRPPNYMKPYIFMALHYQPEATTSPFGGLYSDQLYVIRMISENLPKGWILYVKENKSQLSLRNQHGERSRDITFYKEINKLPNVSFVPLVEDQFKLIDNSKAVVSVNGSVGWEAIVRGKPSIVFSPSWYSEFEHVYNIVTVKHLKLAFDEINAGVEIDQNNVKTFLYALQEVAFTGYTNKLNMIIAKIDKEENVVNFTNAILSTLHKQ